MQLYIMMGILLNLMQKDKIKARQLAEKFEVSERSIYRYINSLSACGVPVSTLSGRNGGIFLSSALELNKIFFTPAELDILEKLIKQEKSTPKTNALLQKIDYLRYNSITN